MVIRRREEARSARTRLRTNERRRERKMPLEEVAVRKKTQALAHKMKLEVETSPPIPRRVSLNSSKAPGIPSLVQLILLPKTLALSPKRLRDRFLRQTRCHLTIALEQALRFLSQTMLTME
jgi:hypothetical protein